MLGTEYMEISSLSNNKNSHHIVWIINISGFSLVLSGKESTCKGGDMGQILVWEIPTYFADIRETTHDYDQ